MKDRPSLHTNSVQRKANPFFAGAAIQPKLTVNTPGDKYEQEADAMADHVMRAIHAGAAATSSPPDEPDSTQPRVQRKCAKCDKDDDLRRSISTSDNTQLQRKCTECEREETLQRAESKEAPTLYRSCDECKIEAASSDELAEDQELEPVADDTSAPDQVSRKEESTQNSVYDTTGLEAGLAKSSGTGKPLPDATRFSMENQFGTSFDQVRVHTDGDAARMNTSIQARAFTHGSDIYFNQGNYNPDSSDGKRLLAHELTHVVQQSGLSVRREVLQRKTEPKIGNWAHQNIQSRLRGKDKKLITEAPIPGGTRDGTEHNTVGFADFYKADQQTVSGIMAQEPQKSKDEAELPAEYEYKNMSRGRTAGSKWSNIASGSTIGYGPRIVNHKKDIWDFTPNFPSNFHVGELKPLFPTEFPSSLAYHGTGFLQAGNYEQGFRKFVKKVKDDHPQHSASLPNDITGHRLNLRDSDIPESINYSKFRGQYDKTDADAIHKRDSKQRVWMFKLKDGVYVYFLMSHPLVPADFIARLEEQRLAKNKLLAPLKQKRTKMPNTLLTKPDVQKRNDLRQANQKFIQKKENKWDTQAKEWEKARKDWVSGVSPEVAGKKPKKFLKEQARGLLKKKKVDDKLNISTTDTKLSEQVKEVSAIRFWSGFKGRILGALRFRFGKTFDKVEELFNKVKEKFKHHHTNSSKLNEKNGIFSGWKKVATRAIIRFSVEILKQMLVDAFKGFMDCINGIIDAILGKFEKSVDEAKSELMQQIEPVCCQIMSFYTELKAEYEKHEKQIASFTETIEKLKQWREILNYVEIAVRAGVQIVSCGLPPGLGCLWGLVAQVGIGAGLSLLARTDYFEDNIAKPAARKLMDELVGDSLHNFMIDLLAKTPLAPFMAEASTCHRRVRVAGSGGTDIGGNLSKLDPNDPAIAKARAEWEVENKDQILKDLKAVFEDGKGRRVIEKDLQKLVDAIKTSNKTPEQVKALIEQSRLTKSGKLNLFEALSYVEKGEAPEKPAVERDYDREKAKENNVKYQSMIGWTPFTFYKKPGVLADSDEFADFIYDMQKAFKINPDGMAGPHTVVAYYEKNNLKGDALLDNANKIIQKEEILKILNEPYPSMSQLKTDIGTLFWDDLSGGQYALTNIDGRRVIYGRTANGSRLAAYYKIYVSEFKGKYYNKLIHSTKFYNLDPIESGDNTGVALVDLNNKKRTILPTMFISAHDKPIPAGSLVDAGDPFFGLLIEEVPGKKP